MQSLGTFFRVILLWLSESSLGSSGIVLSWLVGWLGKRLSLLGLVLWLVLLLGERVLVVLLVVFLVVLLFVGLLNKRL